VTLGDRHRPLRDEVLDEVRRQILSGELAPGTMLNESALATALGVSRLPVREAFRQLESIGLVTAVPRRGVKVAEVAEDEVETVHQIRVALETLAVRRTMERRDDSVIQSLVSLLESGQRAAKDKDGPTLARLNAEFHELLAQGSGSEILRTLLRTVRHQSEHLAGGKHSPMELSWDEHAAIVEAVIGGRTRDATTLMRHHLSDRHAVSLALS
jgi:DNA-binding GntR family transcriptional regulator